MSFACFMPNPEGAHVIFEEYVCDIKVLQRFLLYLTALDRADFGEIKV